MFIIIACITIISIIKLDTTRFVAVATISFVVKTEKNIHICRPLGDVIDISNSYLDPDNIPDIALVFITVVL